VVIKAGLTVYTFIGNLDFSPLISWNDIVSINELTDIEKYWSGHKRETATISHDI
jgi:hypothetical protein